MMSTLHHGWGLLPSKMLIINILLKCNVNVPLGAWVAISRTGFDYNGVAFQAIYQTRGRVFHQISKH